jgi:uncharacterized protein (PEP-CTERM system associated)
MYNKIEETDSAAALNRNVYAASMLYKQQFRERWKGICYLTYEHAKYDQVLAPKRNDNRFSISPSIQYLLNDWLMSELRYTYDMRDSSLDIFEYNTNRVMLSLNFSI